MTIQESDYVYYKRRKYELLSFGGDSLFEPEDVFEPGQFRGFEAPSSANWKGYIATYAAKDKKLLLRNLDCRMLVDPSSPTPTIGGHLPTTNFVLYSGIEGDVGDFTYKKLEFPMPCTGHLIIGGGQILEPPLFPELGAYAWWSYELVHEFHFEDGNLVEARDLTADAERHRLTNPSDTDWPALDFDQ